jgi:hypothetical protein
LVQLNQWVVQAFVDPFGHAAPAPPGFDVVVRIDVILATFDVIAFDIDIARHHAVLLAHARRTGARAERTISRSQRQRAQRAAC